MLLSVVVGVSWLSNDILGGWGLFKRSDWGPRRWLGIQDSQMHIFYTLSSWHRPEISSSNLQCQCPPRLSPKFISSFEVGPNHIQLGDDPSLVPDSTLTDPLVSANQTLEISKPRSPFSETRSQVGVWCRCVKPHILHKDWTFYTILQSWEDYLPATSMLLDSDQSSALDHWPTGEWPRNPSWPFRWLTHCWPGP